MAPASGVHLKVTQERLGHITFERWRASGVLSILAAGAGVTQPTAPGQALVIELPSTASRSLAAYRLDDLTDEPGGA